MQTYYNVQYLRRLFMDNNMTKKKRIRGFMGKTKPKPIEVVGIHKHYEIMNDDGEVLAEAETLKDLSSITGVSIRTLTNRFIKRINGYENCEVLEVLYPIYDDDTIYDITDTEKTRLSYFKKTKRLQALIDTYEG